jgi:hypothetical protein
MLGKAGQSWVKKQFGFEKYIETWDNIFCEIIDNCGSWDSRKNYKSYEMREF